MKLEMKDGFYTYTENGKSRPVEIKNISFNMGAHEYTLLTCSEIGSGEKDWYNLNAETPCKFSKGTFNG